MPLIQVELPADRTKPGSLRIIDEYGLLLAGPYEAYGKADSATAERKGNPGRYSVQPYGDTPLGGYKTVIVRTGEGTSFNFNSFGSSGALVLLPQSGDAEIAKNNGRTGLMIHAGVPGPNGKLRATNGCIRISNQDMDLLMSAISDLSESELSCRVNPGLPVEVVLGMEDDGVDDGDPTTGVLQIINTLAADERRLAEEARRRVEADVQRAAEARRRAERDRRRAEEERRRAEEARRRAEHDRIDAREAAREAREAAREARDYEREMERAREREREHERERERERDRDNEGRSAGNDLA